MSHLTNASRRNFLFTAFAAWPLLKIEALADSCKSTVPSQEGPFYRAGAPWVTRLCRPDEPGQPLIIAGRVTAADTCKPLANAIVDVWQADAQGLYDVQNPKYKGDPTKFYLRGRMRTDAEGSYCYETIVPVNYAAGPNAMRAKHIHYKISAPGYELLTTELYFEGDNYNATDPLVKPALITPVSPFTHPQDKRRYLKGMFNVVLQKAK
jgi:protocatechuate 3,4-dioxygenase beta subunit